MPALSRTRSSSPVRGPEPESGPGPASRSNAAAQERVPAQAPDEGLSSYQAALGSWLGPELYHAVQGALTMEKVQGAAHSGLDAAINALLEQVGHTEAVQAEAAALQALAPMLQDAIGPAVDEWLAGDGRELVQKLSGWTGANPRTVAAVALLTAAGAFLANMPLPTLSRRFGLGEGTSLELSARVGRLRALALQQVKASLTHTAGPLVGAIEIEQAGGATKGAASIGYTGTGRTVEAKGTFDRDGLDVLGVSGSLETAAGTLKGDVSTSRTTTPIATLSLGRADGPLTQTTDFRYDAGTGVLSLGHEALHTTAARDMSVSARAGTDGSTSVSAGLTHRDGPRTTRASASSSVGAYGLTHEDKLALGMDWDRDGLKATLDAGLGRTDTGTVTTVSGKAEKDLGEGYRVGGSFGLTSGDERLLEVGAWYGFKDPGAFRSWLLEYKRTSKLDDASFRALVEDRLGKVAWRAEGTMKWGGSGRNLDVAAHAAYFVNEETAVVAGVSHQRDFEAGTRTTRPELGVQHKGVQVLFGYDGDARAATVRVGVPF